MISDSKTRTGPRPPPEPKAEAEAEDVRRYGVVYDHCWRQAAETVQHPKYRRHGRVPHADADSEAEAEARAREELCVIA